MTITNTEHRIHDRLPSGFRFADRHQAEDYAESGSVNGASKVCLVGTEDGTRLAVRLRPPHTIYDIESPLGYRAALLHDEDPIEAARWYVTQYNLGWQASTRVGRTGQDSEAWDSGSTSPAWDDGYLDHAAGRPKWHLTHCVDHDECGEG